MSEAGWTQGTPFGCEDRPGLYALASVNNFGTLAASAVSMTFRPMPACLSRPATALTSAVLALLVFFTPGTTRAAFFTASEQHVKASLVAAEASVQPGREFTVALRLEHATGGHTYWIFAGTGYATTLKWDLPPGWTAGAIQWPTPVKIIDTHGTITGNGYTGTVYLPVTLIPPAGLKPGETVTLKAKAEWLMCNTDCVPGDATLSLTLPVSATAPVPDPAPDSMAVASASAALPRPVEGWQVEATRTGKTITLRLTPPAGVSPPAASPAPWFFGDNDFVAYDQPQGFAVEPASALVFKLTISSSAEASLKRLTGVVRTEGSWVAAGPALPGLKLDVPLMIVAGPAVAMPAGGLAGALVLAFLGGLILNLMPCVFPVLGIKILGFVNQSGADRRKVVRHGLMFTAGVLLSFWALAGALAALRAGGEQLGWGFQLQSPGFVFGLATVMLVFALNLSGVFEFGLGATAVGGGLQMKSGYLGSFFTGVLATVVATPCSAPFLAPALGTALALPAGPSFVVFTAIALGLSAPYLLLSIFPGAVKILPRPGAWMETLKQFLAFPLYATVGALAWVLVGQVEAEAQLNAIFGLTAVAAATWCYGRFAGPGTKPARARAGIVAGVALLAAGAWLGWPHAPAADDLKWEPWSAERVTALRAEGRIIYVDFTARWCATCQANKKIVFGSDEVRRIFREKKIALLRADWTNRDALIAEELARWGRSAVPFDLVYLPGSAEGRVLPEVLTPGIVLEAIGK